MSKSDPFLQPTYSLRNRLFRLAWGIAYTTLYRLSPRPFHGWRCFLLRLFGARLASGVHPYPTARIWAPWNLICDEAASIGDDAIIYNPKPLHIGSHAIVSQYAFICGATHDYEDPAFPTVSYPMSLGAYSWICARACVQPGVQVGEGAVLALASVATRNLEPWTVYGGIPAKPLKKRILRQPGVSFAELSQIGVSVSLSGQK
jgi:putative colanic acid biosynthesis acetyltransferase WcaF